MLAYHPALDPYHCTFRLVQMLRFGDGRALPVETIRILDFYYVFPFLAEKIRMPRESFRWKRAFKNRENKYSLSGDHKAVFRQMGPLFAGAVSLLTAKAVLDDSEQRNGRLTLARTKAAEASIRAAASETSDEELLEFLVNTLGALPLAGPDGLKARTGLLEFRYDTA